MSTAEENKATVRRFVEAYNQHDLGLADELVAPCHVDPDYDQLQGREGLKQLMSMFFRGFPDFQETIDDMIAEGDKVWLLLTYSGTHTGEWLGLAPIGKRVICKAVDIYRLENGKIVWGRRIPTPDLAFFQQLGFIEYTNLGRRVFQA